MNDLNREVSQYIFDKPYVKQSELIDLFCISQSTLKLWMKTWEDNGGSLDDLGFMPINGIRENTWDPQKFLSFVINHKRKRPERRFSRTENRLGLTLIKTHKPQTHREENDVKVSKISNN